MDQVKLIKEKFQFVLMRGPYELMEYDIAQTIFPKLIYLKTTGYRQEYEKHVLPFDSSDFVAAHLLMCEKTPNGPRPVLGFKSVTLKSCDDHKITFPMLGMLDNSESDPSGKDTIQELLAKYRIEGRSDRIAYNGSFTILPELRQDKNLMKYLWELGFSLLANYYTDYSIDHVLAVCATKFNVHKKKEAHGWNYINSQSGPLKEYQCKALFGASLVPMELYTNSQGCQNAMPIFREMWEERLTLDIENLSKLPKAA